MPLRSTDEPLLEHLHEGFALTERPFAAAARELALSEDDLLERLRALASRGALRRFGPIFQLEMAAERFGLVAVAAGEAPFDDLAARLWALDAVALLRRRQHRFGLWLLLACADSAEEQETVARIARIAAPGALLVFPGQRRGQPQQMRLEGRLLRALGSGMAMLSRPYEALAATLSIDQREVREALQRWLDEGLVQRIGALPREPRHARAMSAVALCDVVDTQLESARARLAEPPLAAGGAGGLVSGTRWRVRQAPLWPFNLWLAVRGASAADLAARRARIAAALGGLTRGAGDMLFAWPPATVPVPAS